MRHNEIVAEDAVQRIATAVTGLYEGQDAVGRASLLGFFHLLRDPARAFVRFNIEGGKAVLLIEAPPEDEG